MRRVFSLDGREAHLAEVVGGKAVGLAVLARLDVSVPPGFAVSAQAYREFIADGRLDRTIGGLLNGAQTLSEQAVASIRVRDLFEARDVGRALLDELAHAYAGLGGGDRLPVAVRSSAIAEDDAQASSAGRHESYLWIRGAHSIARAIVRCWASLFTAQALADFRRMQVHPHESGMGVVVQAMVPAEAAGVMFTIDPVTGDPSQIAIEGSVGLGTGVVGGEVTPDRFYVDKVTLDIRSRVLARQERSCITDDEAVDLALLGKRVERALGAPQDIEWAIASGTREAFLLQARPETVWSRKPRAIVS
jgi:phosphoenolpyruvate synthase/pyruvate phosphate dikinase